VRTTTLPLALLAVLTFVGATACGGDDDAASSTTTAAEAAADPTTTVAEATTTAVPTGRIVAIGEEFLLAQLLALDIEPVASTATVADVGFQGLDDFDTSAIEILPYPDLNLEHVAALLPDKLVIYEQLIETVGGAATLEALADLVVVPDGLTPPEQLEFLADEFGRTAEAEDALTALDAARTEAQAALADCVVSVVTIYPGPSPAVYINDTSPVPAAVIDAGCELVPGPDTAGADRNGRIYISMEQIGLLSAPKILLVSSDTVDGERAAIDSVAADPLWEQLPAVAAGEVSEVDRLGFPGTPGQIRLYEELVAALG
jgi:iron complex transport system substrate-binding protein